ncbi:MAG: hypothetical protein JWO22_3320 [Frankiales bacterium]|nr:hypothetical protein [Frankiales bacterium]
MSIVRRYSFEAAHKLEWHTGKCRELHGHGYVLEVELAGQLDERGVVMDFDDLDKIVKTEVLARLDHRFLNEVVNNPTAELVACQIAEWLDAAGTMWSELRLWETERGSVVLRRQS